MQRLLASFLTVLPGLLWGADALPGGSMTGETSTSPSIEDTSVAKTTPQSPEAGMVGDQKPVAPPNPAQPEAAARPGESNGNATGDTGSSQVSSTQANSFPSPELQWGGTLQLKAIYRRLESESDADKALSFDLRRARVDLDGKVGSHFGFRGEFLLEADEQRLGLEDAYLSYGFNGLVGVRGGKMRRPFSQEALWSSKALYTIERGELYQTFLSETTGYSMYDLGLVLHGGFGSHGVPVNYEVGIFNGKQSLDPLENYAGQHYQGLDRGFKAKDLAMRLSAEPLPLLSLEAAISTKTAEDRSNPDNLEYSENSAYQAGLNFHHPRLRLLGEVAWGDNHQGRDSLILAGSTSFFAFYALAAWHEEYTRGRATEVLIKIEGLDPDFEGAVNDGTMLYTLGANYFFAPQVSILGSYSVRQPLSMVPGEDGLQHNVEMMWRLSF